MEFRLLQFKQNPRALSGKHRHKRPPSALSASRQYGKELRNRAELSEDINLIRKELFTDEVGVQVTEPQPSQQDTELLREANLDLGLYERMRYDEVKTTAKGDYASGLDKAVAQVMLHPQTAQTFFHADQLQRFGDDTNRTHKSESPTPADPNDPWDYTQTLEYQLKVKEDQIKALKAHNKRLEERLDNVSALGSLVEQNIAQGKKVIELDHQVHAKHRTADTPQENIDALFLENAKVLDAAAFATLHYRERFLI